MAYALRPQSARGAQVQRRCDLCETDTNIQYRCVQCQKYMCEKCNKIHLNVQTSVKHEIKSIRSTQDYQDTSTSMIIGNIHCDNHKKKLFIKYCVDCTELVCEDCIDKGHRIHQLKEINEGCDSDILKTEARLSKDLWFYENETKLLQKTTQMYNSSLDNARKKIDGREKEMKEAIEKYANELRAVIETGQYRLEKLRKTSEKKIREFRAILKEKESQLKKAKESNRVDKIIKAIRKIDNDHPYVEFIRVPLEVCCLVLRDMNMSELFGSLQFNLTTLEESNFDLQVIKSHTTTEIYADRLLTLDYKTAWISNYHLETLNKIDIGDKIKTVKNISLPVYDMSLTASKDILLSFYDTDVCLLTTKTGEIVPYLSVSPLYSLGVHITKHNDIMLCVTEGGDSYKLTDKSCRKVIFFGTNRKQKKAYEYDKHKQRLFTFPFRITSHVNNDILVIDRTSRLSGRVVVMDRDGQVKWTYHGHPQVNPGNRLFDPIDIVSTSEGHVIMADEYNHALHVLSGEGVLLSCKDMQYQGVTWPRSLDIDTMGLLWVGNRPVDYKLCDGKLHMVKYSS